MPKAADVSQSRRIEVGAERRSRSRLRLLRAAADLLGTQDGGNIRLSDILKSARISRGTFYNHFTSLTEFHHTLSDALSREFDHSVNQAFAQMSGAAEESAAGLRYYLYAAAQNPKWGWVMVNTMKGPAFFGHAVYDNATKNLDRGIASGELELPDAAMGRDILFGIAITSMYRLLSEEAPEGYIEEIASRLLIAYGLSVEKARDIANRPLPPLPALSGDDQHIIDIPRITVPDAKG
ncbi:TetR/AcrR family transcriptional regulator [Pseudooceanicola sp. MF1-13]|uniref:TetR/AcrR family transcriptional regulator n=1 Tax=Pseudooceanicola sp. MF1-13 TaxID=3379095 RepID=UPI0038916DCA